MSHSSDEDLLKENPMSLLHQWLQEAQSSSPLKEPWAMALATVSQTGELHNRIVLLKQVRPDGLVFFTNYNSTKGSDLEATPQAEGVFHWDHLMRQVRIGGPVEKTSREISENYWNSRPRESQISQWVSHQSVPVESRKHLEELVIKAHKKFDGQSVPCPDHWGGYLIKADRLEFWLGSPTRLHDRFHFRKDGSSWTSHRLYP